MTIRRDIGDYRVEYKYNEVFITDVRNRGAGLTEEKTRELYNYLGLLLGEATTTDLRPMKGKW